jgi:hypothetical protein
MTLDASFAATASLLVFVALSFVDGILVHLWRERLHLRAGSRGEHALHTARAVLFPFILVMFFASPSLVGVLLLAADQAIEIADMAVERASRAYSGGLRSTEYVLHGTLITLRSAAVAFTFASDQPVAAGLVSLLLPGAALAAILHVILLVAPGIMVRTPPGAALE